MRIVKALLSLFFVTLVASGCASGSSTTIGGHTFSNVPCSLIGAAIGASAGGAAANLGGAAMGALGGAVMAQYFCGEEEMMEMEAEVTDADGDGVPDAADDCPYTPADTPNGCPADSDGDGVPDYLDECPDVPGDEETGCPPEPMMETVFIESIHFDFDSAEIKSHLEGGAGRKSSTSAT